MVENDKSAHCEKAVGFTHWKLLTHLFPPILSWVLRGCIDSVDAGTYSVNEDLVACYLGYYDWGRGVPHHLFKLACVRLFFVHHFICV
jgi:hypothetical protein